ncbi:EpsG family protein [Providencia stuartii]
MKNKLIFSFIFSITIILLSILICYLSIYIIYNPDKLNYISLIHSCSLLTPCPVEPSFWVISDCAQIISSLFDIDIVFTTYFLFQIITLYLIYLSALLFFDSYTKIILFFTIYLFCYSLIVITIQIRFGLALGFSTLAFSMLYNNYTKNVYAIPITLGSLSHFSILPLFIFIVKNIFNLKITLKKYLSIIIFFTMLLYSIKYRLIFIILPDFVSARLYQYFITNLQPSSFFNQVVSIVLMLWFSIALFKIKRTDEKDRWLLLFGCISFIPYIVYPEMEILIRIFIPFQYLLMVFYIKTFIYSRYFILTTAPLTVFFLYKAFSSSSYIFNLIP